MSTDAFQAPSPDFLAQLLPQYGIDSFIAQGGMGAVYKGRQLSLDRDVAIKVLPKELGGDAEFRESFLTEAKAMAKLNHPNLLGVFDYGDVGGMPYIVMEYVQGGSLHQAAWNQAMDPQAAVGIVKGICDGIAHAHENGIVHRDIKPSNILLTTKAEPKVADFGLAHSTDSEESGMMMGTPGYTAPEVFHDPSQAGTLADMYSVGVILHQLLTGIDPAGSSGPPTKATGNIRLDAIWRKATNINPSQRFGSMAELSADLGKWLGTSSKAAVATGDPAYRPPARPTKTAKAGGGIFVKLIIIAALGSAVYYTYVMLQENTAKIDKAIADSKNNAANPPVKRVIRIEAPTAVTNGNAKSSAGNTQGDAVNAPVVGVESEPEKAYTPGDPGLLQRAIGLINTARKKRDGELADNASAMHFEIGATLRSAKPDDAAYYKRLQKEIIGNRIPLTDDDELPANLSRAYESARSKEESILEKHRTELTRIRDAYTTRLAATAAKESDAERKANLLKQAESAEDLDEWVGKLAPGDE